MKVLLVPPTFGYSSGQPNPLSVSDFPSGFAYIAAALKQAGHDVVGLNPNNIGGYPSAKVMLQDVLTRKLAETKPDMVGLGGLCTDYAFLQDAINIIRSLKLQIPIVLGGQIVTNDADDIFDLLKPDYAIIGEAEHAFVDLLERGGPGGIIRAIPPENLDELPFPDYEPFGVQDMMDNYSMATRLLYRYSRPDPRPFNIVASRGCPFSCTFCIHGRRAAKYRVRSIDDIMEEIRQSYDKYNFNILIILDELFAVDKSRMREFCDAVLVGRAEHGWDFDWMFQTHASAKFDLETLKLAKKAGCFFFSYGLESASPTVIKSMKKKIKIPQVIEAMELAKEAKLGFGGNLIFGDPAETEETWAESLRFWLEHCQGNFVFLATLMPYPGSAIFDPSKYESKKWFYENIDKKVTNLTQIPDKTFQDLMNLTMHMEQAWLFVKQSPHVEVSPNGHLSILEATCPYCGEVSTYHEHIQAKPFFLGIGCVHCHQRMRVPVESGV